MQMTIIKKDNTKKNETEKIDFLSKFICTVNKPVYYFITAFTIPFWTSLAAMESMDRAYIIFCMATVIYFIFQYMLYEICRKRKNINLQKVSLLRKMWFIISSVLVILVFTFILAMIQVLEFVKIMQ